MRWPTWIKRYGPPEKVPHTLRNGETVWVYPGERIIDKTGEGMEKVLVYLNGKECGWIHGKDAATAQSRVLGIVGCTDAVYTASSHGMHELRIECLSWARPEVVETILGLITSLKNLDPLAEAARAFEQAINAEPGIEASIEYFDQHIVSEATLRRRCTVKVTRATTEQVYP